ncbi:MAG: V-type ATP synthase subunit D [Candidatus Improbicoccus pseudotrichonymphae]|uniref:V-type ATP synthase subunit D n=1 Tax=Candidatus Improbicoccus pseudotrichonymphae TaxID=3033792 RepID=A0AA48HYJ5_9FIRM|nr:MAG: V-type ATP synthase subunit D [Candidatus Improbicoccus pseudotrichonymphae]
MQNKVVSKNLLNSTKNSLILAKNGCDIMKKKRNILMKELLMIKDKIEEIQQELLDFFSKAYSDLRDANISLGLFTKELASVVEEEVDLNLTYRSIMGIEIPVFQRLEYKKPQKLPFGLHASNSLVDKTYLSFMKVKVAIVKYAELETSIFLISKTIIKIKKKINALENLAIPKLEEDIRDMTTALEEKEREEFTRMKIIKEKKIL